MNIDQFISTNNIQPADAIVVKKQYFGILDHYVIYLGVGGDGEHKFIASFSEGIKFVSYWKIMQFMQDYIPVKINRFIGDYFQRKMAVDRALSRHNENNYHLILNNCEHFKNYVHYGVEYSEQVRDFGALATVSGLGLAAAGLAKKNQGLAIAGAVTTILGLLTIALED